jgi:ribA/ribD-fused uncharacterized protein
MSQQIIRRFRGAYGFLSNFATCDVAGWRSVEHAFQAAKTDSPEWRLRIQNAPTAALAKRLGRQVPIRENWEEIKVDQMRALLRLKFKQEPFRSRLLETEEAVIIEENDWHDNFYGVCRCERCTDVPAQNWLGRLLMEIRDDLRIEAGWTKNALTP